MAILSNAEHENFSNVIGLIYDSAQNPELWPELLHQIDNLINDPGTQSSGGKVSLVTRRESYLDILRPHFQRAMQQNRMLYDLKSERDAVSSILDRLPIGVILVNSERALFAINRHAEKIVSSGAVISIHDGKLKANTLSDTKLIEQHIKLAIGETEASGKGWNLILHSDTTLPCSLHITPSIPAGIETEAHLVAILVSCAAINPDIDVAALEDTYRLTHAEGRLLKALVNGSHSLSEAASNLGVSKHTVRSQFKSILEKTGTHSQSEVIKMVLCGPSALIGENQEVTAAPEPKRINSDNQSLPTDSKLLKLFDGRKLEYQEFGDPDGIPVLYFHGLLHSKKQFHPLSDYIQTHGVRVIAPERPGFGYTDRQKERSISSFCGDIRQLTEHLGIEKYYTFGDGDGGPWAIACACLMPERVCRTAVCGCMPDPTFERLENLLPFDRKLQTMARSMPRPLLYSFSKIVLKALKRNNNYFELMAKDFYESDQKVISSSEHKALFSDAMEDITPGNIEGFIDDYFSRLEEWDFPIEETTTEVHLWHGVHDRFSDIDSAIGIAAALPNCKTFFLENQGHYVFISHCDEILHRLIHG